MESKVWHKWTYLQTKNRLTDTEDRLVLAKEGGEEDRSCMASGKWLLTKSKTVRTLLVAQRLRHCLQCRRGRFDPSVGTIPWEGSGSPLQYSCLEHSMGRGAWRVTVHGLQRVRQDWGDRARAAQWQVLGIETPTQEIKTPLLELVSARRSLGEAPHRYKELLDWHL